MADYACDYCIWKSIKERAQREDRTFTVLEEDDGFCVYVHPSQVHPKYLSGPAKEEHFVRWFELVPMRCSCDERPA